MPEYFYVIRWSPGVSVGDFEVYPADYFVYLTELRVGSCGCGADFDALRFAIRFGSWAEAASVAAFIIHHIDEMYEDALEVVKVEL